MVKKILFVLHLPPPVHGAAMVGKYIQDSKLINGSFDCDYINLSTSKSLEDIGKGGLNKISTLAGIQLGILSALRKKNYDLCYMTLTAQGPGFFKDLLIVALLKVFGIKIVYHFHNKGISTKQDNWIMNLLYRFAFKGTKSILLSKYLYSDIQKYVKVEDVYYCPNGIPASAENSGDGFSVGKGQGDAINILFLSNMMEEKGVWILLEACALLKSRSVKFVCHFVGAWSDITENEFDRQVEKLGLSELVFAHGRKYNEEKKAFFQQANVFVFPTYYHNEAFSLVILEAFQHALPVISTAEGGIRDMVVDGETGFLVERKNKVELADKIEVLYEQPMLRIKLGKEGKERYLKRFTLSAFEERMKGILCRVLDR